VQTFPGNNPNATVTALAGSTSVLFVWIAQMAGLGVPPEVASAATTLFAGLILWIGRPRRLGSPGLTTSSSIGRQAA
jgi:hypothetical protein